MGSCVPLQIEGIVEAFEAVGAEVFLVAIVGLQVSDQTSLHIEGLSTFLALPTVVNFLA